MTATSDDVLDDRLCPFWVEPDGTRCLRLPSGVVYRRTEEQLAEFFLDTYTSDDPAERHLAVIDRMTTEEERDVLFETLRFVARRA